MYRWFLVATLVVGVVSGYVERGTFAFVTSSTQGSNQFSAGTVTLSAQENSSGVLTLSGLTLGSTTTAQVNVQNTGNLTLRYAVSLSTTGNATLASTLQMTIRADATNDCTSVDGTVLSAAGALSSAGFGNSATGSHSGDREMAPGASESLCFIVNLPSNASSSLQSTSTTVTYTFSAEQVVGT